MWAQDQYFYSLDGEEDGLLHKLTRGCSATCFSSETNKAAMEALTMLLPLLFQWNSFPTADHADQVWSPFFRPQCWDGQSWAVFTEIHERSGSSGHPAFFRCRACGITFTDTIFFTKHSEGQEQGDSGIDSGFQLADGWPCDEQGESWGLSRNSSADGRGVGAVVVTQDQREQLGWLREDG